MRTARQRPARARLGHAPRACAAVALLLACAFWLAPPAHGQSPAATLTGTVADPDGAAVAGASVTIVHAETGVSCEAAVDGGSFSATNLPPGRYAVTVRREGFRSLIVRDVKLAAGERRAMPLTLEVGRIDESVAVEGASLVEAESGALGTRIGRGLVDRLPLNGRSFNSLLELAPGVTLAPSGPGSEGQYSVNGQRTNANAYAVDGVGANIGIAVGSNRRLLGVAGATPGLSVLGGTNSLVSVDAVEEVEVQTSTYAADLGRVPGGQVTVVTRSGTNEVHGTLFEYFRNDALDANDWFANSFGLESPPLRHNQFGGVLGGPIRSDRTFYFASYEGLRLREGRVESRPVPSMRTRQRAPAELAGIFGAFPVPNGPNARYGLREFRASFANPSALDAASIRIDHLPSSRVSLFGRYNRSPSYAVVRGDADTSLNMTSRAAITTETLTAGSTQQIGPRVANDFRVNYSRTRTALHFDLDEFGGARPPADDELFPFFTDASNTLRVVLVGQAYFFAGKAAKNLQRQVNVVDHLSIAGGAHQLRFGVDYRRMAPVADQSAFYLETKFEAALNPLLAEVPRTVLQKEYSSVVATVFHNLSLYAQDSWKATPRLTLACGVRWEINPPPAEDPVDGAVVATIGDDPSSARLLAPGEPRWRTSLANFAPRASAAFAARSAAGWETVLRGGWGLFYDLGSGPVRALAAPATTKVVGYAPYPLAAATLEPLPPRLRPPFGSTFDRVPAFSSDLELPRTHHWNLTVEQALGSDQVMSASYVGAAGRALLWNEVLVDPTPELHEVMVTRNGATSDYHALQVRFERRLSRGLGALASYTYAHAIDTESSEVPVHPSAALAGPEADRASASFDVRHAFTAAATYDVPAPRGGRVAAALLGDWSVDAIVRARTAFPVNVLSGNGFGGVLFGSARPDPVPGVPVYVDDAAAPGGLRINPAAFAPPPTSAPGVQVRQGALGRNALRGFDASQLDVAMRRGFDVTERLRLHLRAEVFNLFNHPNFADPESNLGWGDLYFGRSWAMLSRGLGGLSPIHQVGGPRSVQLVVKLQF